MIVFNVDINKLSSVEVGKLVNGEAINSPTSLQDIYKANDCTDEIDCERAICMAKYLYLKASHNSNPVKAIFRRVESISKVLNKFRHES